MEAQELRRRLAQARAPQRQQEEAAEEPPLPGSLPAALLLLPPGDLTLPGRPSDSFYSRLNRARAADCSGPLVALVSMGDGCPQRPALQRAALPHSAFLLSGAVMGRSCLARLCSEAPASPNPTPLPGWCSASSWRPPRWAGR